MKKRGYMMEIMGDIIEDIIIIRFAFLGSTVKRLVGIDENGIIDKGFGSARMDMRRIGEKPFNSIEELINTHRMQKPPIKGLDDQKEF